MGNEYSNGVAAARSATLLDQKLILQLLDGSLPQFFDVLKTTCYANNPNLEHFDQFVDEELENLCNFVLKECSNKDFANLFLLPKDFANFCADIVAKREFKKLNNQHLKSAILQVLELDKQNLNDFEADNIFKKHLFCSLKEQTKDDFVKKLLNFVLDVENIQIAIRCETDEDFCHQKLPNGDVDNKLLELIVNKNKDFLRLCPNNALASLAKILLGEGKQKFEKFEVQKRVEILNFVLQFATDNQTCAQFASYVFKKQFELENLRIIHNLKKLGLDDEIKSNLVL